MNEDRPYKIILEDRGEYLYALVSGEKLSAEIATMYWGEIADKCSELEKSKILIEKDFPEHVSPPEMLQMSVYVGSILAGTQIAFVDRYDNSEVNELGKVMARNKGVLLKIFTAVEKAEEWLA